MNNKIKMFSFMQINKSSETKFSLHPMGPKEGIGMAEGAGLQCAQG